MLYILLLESLCNFLLINTSEPIHISKHCFLKLVVNARACSEEGEVMLIDGPNKQEGKS